MRSWKSARRCSKDASGQGKSATHVYMSARSSRDRCVLRVEYEATASPHGMVRGKFVARASMLSNVVVVDPDLETPRSANSVTINRALGADVKAAQ